MKKIQRGFYKVLLFLLLTQAHLINAEELPEQHWFKQDQAVLLEELDQERGTGSVFEITTYNNIDADGVVSNNTANNNVNGSNIIDHSSFSEAGGIISVIQNTGNNVLIQDTTLVNINVLN